MSPLPKAPLAVMALSAMPAQAGGSHYVDGEGRYWYMGSHNGKLGVIE